MIALSYFVFENGGNVYARSVMTRKILAMVISIGNKSETIVLLITPKKLFDYGNKKHDLNV